MLRSILAVSSIFRGTFRLLPVGVLLTAGAIASSQPALATTPTVTTLSVSSSTVKAQQPITLTATVRGNGVAVSPGQVVFCNASAVHCEDLAILGTAQLVSNGTATIKVLLPVGAHSIYAKFLGIRGTAALASSSSLAALTTVTGGQNPVDAQIFTAGSAGSRTLTASVDIGAAAATGTVSFRDVANNNVIASAPLQASTAMFSLNPGVFYSAQVPVAGEFNRNIESVVRDVNNDGIPDLIAVAPYGGANSEVSLAIAVSLGDPAHPGSFLDPQYYPAYTVENAVTPASLAVADFNGDGVLDVAIVDVQNGLTISLGDISHPGQFLPGTTYALPNYANNVDVGPNYICTGDFDGDGLPDIAVALSSMISLTIRQTINRMSLC